MCTNGADQRHQPAGARPGSHRCRLQGISLDKGAHGIELFKGFGIVLDRRAVLERLSEEHGVLKLDSDEPFSVDNRIRVIPNYACTVINLFDSAYGIRKDRVEEVFKTRPKARFSDYSSGATETYQNSSCYALFWYGLSVDSGRNS